MAIAQYQGTGRRKESVARVRLVPGTGVVKVNQREVREYFNFETLVVKALEPLKVTGTADKYDVIVRVHGGGFTGQSGAIRHGIARALLQVDASYRPTLKKEGMLTRDSRMVERKKYGLKKARRAPQFSKR